MKAFCLADGIEMEPEKKVKKRLTIPLPGSQKDKLKSDFLLTKENHIPLKAARFQTGDWPTLYPEGM